MTTITWDDVLSAIREGKQTVPTAQNGLPVVAVNAPLYELMQLMEAMTTGYNNLILRARADRQKMENIRKLAKAHFPAEYRANSDGWVSVKDALPEKSGMYLTYDKYVGIYAYRYSAKNKKFNSADDDDGQYAVCVEYWHPSPLPPVKEAKQ